MALSCPKTPKNAVEGKVMEMPGGWEGQELGVYHLVVCQPLPCASGRHFPASISPFEQAAIPSLQHLLPRTDRKQDYF